MQERDIFIATLEKSATERSSYLAGACGEDRDLRQRVEELLAEHEKEQSFFLDAPLPGAGATIDQPAKEKPGTQIGPYKLLQQIGEGGFGIVFMAEQHAPVKRKVALKVIKPGMDTRQVIARFEAERQALALMDHPSIAKVFDAGATDSGRPYFVMELVRGVPITTYCDENNLPVRERLVLFASVCQAIQHAHTKGIIHRDIKPTNVLITRQDGQPIVKVIDFGVAKAMGQQLTDKTLFTEFAQMIGTPLYMSPEQAELTSVDIDTRSDIYSLGVLLYELLTGSTPVRKEQMKQAAFDELRRIIREDEPQKPSTRISGSGTLASIAAQRHIDPARLSRLVRGELDWIVMKALEKDRNRRYETASGFAADVQRYLNDEPVSACPPSLGYRLRKFAGRNKAALMTIATLALATLVAVGSIGWKVRDQSARHAQLNYGVEVAVHEASSARDRALNLTGNRSEWQAALAAALGALQRAQAIAGQDEAGLDPELRERLQELQTRVADDEADRRFVTSFDDTLGQVLVWDARRSQSKREEAYFKLKSSFNDCYALEFGTTPTAEVATLLDQRPEPILAHLLSALHVCLACAPQNDPKEKQWLMDILQAVDDDPWRKQAREAFLRSDWSGLEQLIKEVTVTRHPPALLLLLSSYLPGDAWTTKHDLVLQIQQRYPGEPGVSRFGNALTCDILAWTFSDPEIGNEKRAIDLAKRAVSLAPNDADFWNTLGVAYYRAGNWKQAVTALEKARELSAGGDAVDWLFLAMAHWQLGNKEEAHDLYTQALHSPKTSKLLEAELPRFRAEAAKLLGIDE